MIASPRHWLAHPGYRPGLFRVRGGCVLLVLLRAASAPAHIVPVPPSACAFDPVTIEAPGSGVIAAATPAGPTDQFRILYDP